MSTQLNSFIDAVQGAKTSFIKTWVSDKEVAKSLQSLVDAQTTMSKQVVSTASDMGGYAVEQFKSLDLTKAFSFAK